MKNRIKELRKKNYYTQEDLSKLLKNEGISANRVTIARYEAGLRTPSDETWKGLAKVFSVPINYLKGAGLRANDIPRKTLELLVTTYYDNDDEYFKDLFSNINNCLLIKNGKNTADTFSKEQSLHEDYAILFWKKMFSFLFTQKFIKYNDGVNEIEFINNVILSIKNFIHKNTNENDLVFLINYNKLNKELINQFYAKNNSENFDEMLTKFILFLTKWKKYYIKHEKR